MFCSGCNNSPAANSRSNKVRFTPRCIALNTAGSSPENADQVCGSACFVHNSHEQPNFLSLDIAARVGWVRSRPKKRSQVSERSIQLLVAQIRCKKLDDVSMEVPAPDVPGILAESHDNFVRSNGNLEMPKSDCVKGELHSVKMVDTERLALTTLRPRIDSLCP